MYQLMLSPQMTMDLGLIVGNELSISQNCLFLSVQMKTVPYCLIFNASLNSFHLLF